MATYEVEHNISAPKDRNPSHPARRPDLSTFFTNLEQVDTSNTANAHAVPIPGEVAATYRTLAGAFERMRQDGGGEALESLVEFLLQGAEAPPKEIKGVSDEYLSELPRIPKAALKPTDTCPICNNPFLEDEYPLVVRLPCHASHLFDLECITPWLKLNPTCPLDRVDLVEKKKPPPPPPVKEEEEEDGEWDDMYA